MSKSDLTRLAPVASPGDPTSEARARDALLAAREKLAGADPAAVAPVVREIDAALARLHAGPAPAGRDLLSIICHDLKDPLASIVMGAGFLKRALPDDDASAPVKRVALAILRASERMNLVIGDFHDLGKLEAGRVTLELRPHEVGVLLRAAADQLAPAARARGLELAVEVDDESVRASCDRPRVLQMIEKLVNNAIKFTPPAGKVTLHAARRDGHVWVAVSDNGKGVPDARKPTVFDRQTNAAQTPRDGPGLGLAIVRELALLHGGDVGVEDNEGGAGSIGATFWFTLPSG